MKSSESCLVEWCADRIDMTGRGKDCGLCSSICSPRCVSYPSWLVSHNASSRWANTGHRSYHGDWSTFTSRTLIDKSSFRRIKAVQPCPSANGSFDTTPNEENLCKSADTTPARHTVAHQAATSIRMRLSLNGSLCARKKGLCQFQPGFPLLGRSTVTQLVTWCVHWPIAKTSESSAKKGGKLHSTPPPTWKNIHEGTSQPLFSWQQVHCCEYIREFWQCREEEC